MITKKSDYCSTAELQMIFALVFLLSFCFCFCFCLFLFVCFSTFFILFCFSKFSALTSYFCNSVSSPHQPHNKVIMKGFTKVLHSYLFLKCPFSHIHQQPLPQSSLVQIYFVKPLRTEVAKTYLLSFFC